MARFKVGDKVRCIRPDDEGELKNGEIYTVDRCKEYTMISVVDGYGSWDIDRFELVEDRFVAPKDGLYRITGNRVIKETPADHLTLEELVKCANRGINARDYLTLKHSGKYEWMGNEYRVKPQKTFESYTIESTGWRVTPTIAESQQALMIGCTLFNAKSLTEALRALIEEEKTTTKSMEVHLFATVRGARYEGHVLPWSDAKELLRRLEEYLND